MEVVEGDGDLDEALEEELLGLRGGEPDALPGLVGFEELAGAVEAEAFCEGAVGPVEGHGMSLSSGAVGGAMRKISLRGGSCLTNGVGCYSRERRHTPGAKAPLSCRPKKAKAKALAYLEARACSSGSI
jgi:hypothetical protein